MASTDIIIHEVNFKKAILLQNVLRLCYHFHKKINPKLEQELPSFLCLELKCHHN